MLARQDAQKNGLVKGIHLIYLQREAANNAAALGVWGLIGKLDFSQWLHSTLLKVTHKVWTFNGDVMVGQHCFIV